MNHAISLLIILSALLQTRVNRLSVEEPQQALALIDSALNEKSIPPYQADFLRAIVYTQDDAEIDSAQLILENLLKHDSVVNNTLQKAHVLAQLVNLNRIRKDDERVLFWGTQLMELNAEVASKAEKLSLQVEIGLSLTNLGHTKEGLTKIDEAIGKLQDSQEFTEFYAWLIAMKRKIRVMNEQENYKQSIELAQQIILKINDFYQHPETYKDAKGKKPSTPEERQAFYEKNLAQAYAYLAYAYASIGARSKDLVLVKNMQIALKYAHQFEMMKYGQTCTGRKLICSTWFKMGEYKKMYEAYGELKEKWGSDTLHADYATMLKHMAQASYHEKRYQESNDYWKRYTALSQKLYKHTLQTSAQDHAARYHEQENMLKLQQAENELAINRIVLFSTFLLIIIAITLAFYFNRVRRHIADKNRALVKMINELEDSKDETVEKTRNEKRDNKLFDEIDSYIRTERLYTDPGLQRQDILDHFSINKNTLNTVFNEHNGGLSFPAYINNLRLEEGQHLLRSNPEKNITDIATAIGFTAPNFREQFKKKYGITPTEFRQNL